MALPCSSLPQELPARWRGMPSARRPPVTGSRTGRLAIWSSLLFSWTWIKSLGHLAFQGLAKGVLANLLERHGLDGDVLDGTVIELVALPQEINPLLWIRDDCDHSMGATHDSINTQRSDHQPCFSGRKILRRFGTLTGLVQERIERIAPRCGNFCLSRFFDRWLGGRFLCGSGGSFGRRWRLDRS